MAREKISPEELSIEPLSARFNLSPFDSGDEDLNEFLKDDALDEQQILLNKTRLCFCRDRVAGYIALVADSVRVDRLDDGECLDDCRYPIYPCLLIARLAVDRRLHGRGLGTYLLLFAIGAALDGPIGCRYLVVDPKEDAVKFYEDFGFKYLKKSRRMLLNVREAARQLKPLESLDPWMDEPVDEDGHRKRSCPE
jgi:GNAT superfamily N-acetyltransferase